MTVKELIEMLQELPQDIEVLIADGHEIMFAGNVTTMEDDGEEYAVISV